MGVEEVEVEVEGDSYLKIHFHVDQCKRAITVKGFFFSRERQRYFSVLGENMQYEFCRDSFMLLSLKTYIQL